MSQHQVPKRLKKIVKAAEEQGWTYDVTRDGHPRLTPLSGTIDIYKGEGLQKPVTFAKTGGKGRGDANGSAALRRAGIKI